MQFIIGLFGDRDIIQKGEAGDKIYIIRWTKLYVN
jgi:hypothetical protein